MLIIIETERWNNETMTAIGSKQNKLKWQKSNQFRIIFANKKWRYPPCLLSKSFLTANVAMRYSFIELLLVKWCLQVELLSPGCKFLSANICQALEIIWRENWRKFAVNARDFNLCMSLSCSRKIVALMFISFFVLTSVGSAVHPQIAWLDMWVCHWKSTLFCNLWTAR